MVAPPRAILSSTFSDELSAAYGNDSKVFAVSVKDRGAIPLAGQMGKAFWFSRAAGEFVTSNYYYDAYPQWVLDWNNYHEVRSGDIYLVLQSGAYVNDFDGLVVASTHGSPWNYDTHVPIIFAGPGIKAKSVSRQVSPYDIAPTLSDSLGIESPSGASGHPLPAGTGD